MWSIGIYRGESPFHLRAATGINNPVLTGASVGDVRARFVADPFMVQQDGVWYMFFEVLNQAADKGDIGLAISEDGLAWTYQQIVLAEPFHLSYPYVFAWDGQHYMIPETLAAGAVRLYKADDFPRRWSCVGELIKGSHADPSVFYFDGRWWMFACSTPYQHDTLRLYFAAALSGPWVEHPVSPVVKGNPRHARPGGRVLVLDDKVTRFAQDCVLRYGTQVRAFEISELTPTSYLEKEMDNSPVLTAGDSEWNALGMHHIDPHLMPDGQWIACVDGFSNTNQDLGTN